MTDGIRLAVATEESQRLERALASRGPVSAGSSSSSSRSALLFWRSAAWTPLGSRASTPWPASPSGRGCAATTRRPRFAGALQALDILAAAILSIIGDEVLVLVGVLAIYAAAARWTRIEAIETAAAISLLALAGQILLLLPFRRGAGFDGHAFFFRTSTLFLLSFLFSHVTRRQKELQDETLKAKAMDRALVARELHDGAIQSLIGMEVQVAVLRRRRRRRPRCRTSSAASSSCCGSEVLNLRELMRQMKPLDLDPRRLLDFLAESVDKFRRETGISASFVSDLREVALSPRICTELARIAQEALVNVRKHSGASNVIVRLAMENGSGRLVVDDDGRGFDFSGRLTADRAGRGPEGSRYHQGARSGDRRPVVRSNRSPERERRLEITLPDE